MQSIVWFNLKNKFSPILKYNLIQNRIGNCPHLKSYNLNPLLLRLKPPWSWVISLKLLLRAYVVCGTVTFSVMYGCLLVCLFTAPLPMIRIFGQSQVTCDEPPHRDLRTPTKWELPYHMVLFKLVYLGTPPASVGKWAVSLEPKGFLILPFVRIM